jgi:hypothetical protein
MLEKLITQTRPLRPLILMMDSTRFSETDPATRVVTTEAVDVASTEVEVASAVMVVDVAAAAEVLVVPLEEARDAAMSLEYSKPWHAVNAQPTNLLESPEGNCTS